MLIRTFREMENYVLSTGIKKRIVLANAHDTHTLPAVADARRKGVAEVILIGHKEEILRLLQEENEHPEDYEIIDCNDDAQCARMAIEMVKLGKADMPMKGLMQTSDFMRAVLNKENGLLPAGNLVSQLTVVEKEDGSGFFGVTDCAINIAPDLETKKKIVKNAVDFAHRIGVAEPKVAALCALEIPNPKIPSTMDASALQKAWEDGEITGCKIGGPLDLATSISPEAAVHKGVHGPVHGDADILLVPDLDCGNILTKSLIFFARAVSCGTILGTKTPIIMASRTDTPENKYRAILTCLFMAAVANKA